MLGADVPCVALIDAIARRPQRVTVVLWSQSRRTADLETANAVIGARARLLVGGPGWASAKLPKNAIRVDSLHAALRRLRASSQRCIVYASIGYDESVAQTGLASGEELVVLVDEGGKEIRTAAKACVHHEATPLHLAFSRISSTVTAACC